jgi:hypothetical protein
MTRRPRPAVDRRHDELEAIEREVQEAVRDLDRHLRTTYVPRDPRWVGDIKMIPAADFAQLDVARRHYDRLYAAYTRAAVRHHADRCC